MINFRSSEWGISPYQYYFTNLLPKSLLTAYPFSILSGIVSVKARPLAVLSFGFVTLYSKLAHKEVRLGELMYLMTFVD